MTRRYTSALGILAAALLFLSMFAGLFGGALSQGGTAPERQCTNCFRWGHWWGDRCPHCGAK